MTDRRTQLRIETSLAGGAAVAVVLVLAGCASDLPEDPGLYAVTSEGEVQRLSGGPKWERETWGERSNLPDRLRFFIVQPSIAEQTDMLSERIKLRRVNWVRSEITPTGSILPVSGGEWTTTDLEAFEVPLAFDHVGQRTDIIAAVPPGGALPSGLYALELRSNGISVNSRFGIHWPTVDQKQFAADNCVDRYQQQSGVLYRPCGAQEAALATVGLQLYMVTPERMGLGDDGPIVVKGVVVNTSDYARTVPMLEGRLLDEDGEELRSWQFSAMTGEVPPGKSVSFGTVVEHPPPNVARVSVQFAQPTLSQNQP